MSYDEAKSRKEKIREKVVNRIDLLKEISDDEILDIIDEEVIAEGHTEYISLKEKGCLRKEIFNAIRKLDILQELIDDKDITEIMVNGAEDIFIEKDGGICAWDKMFESNNKLCDVVQQIVSEANRMVNESNPIVDVRLRDGSRVNVVLPPVAINGPVVTIRKFPESPITMETLLKYHSITKEAAVFLDKLVKAKYNIFISGGTGSGKTTFLNVLTSFIPVDERIITIEDSAELQIRTIPNLVRMEVRNANVEGENGITMRDLIKSALRMRPDRIIVGEVRDSAAIDMLMALNTGHDGSLSTGHANNPADMLGRLESLVLMGMEIPLLAIRKQIASAIDIIVHLGRLRDKSRRVLEIVEVLGCVDGEIELNPLFVFQEEREDDEGIVLGELKQLGNDMIQMAKLKRAGIML